MYTKEEAKEIRQQFWNGFADYTNKKRRKQGVSGKWILSRTGINALNLKFDIDQKSALVGIDLETSNMEKRLELYEKIEATKKILHETMKCEMRWELEYTRENGKSISRISTSITGVDLYNPDTWNRAYLFFFQKMDALESYFREYKDYLRYG